MRILLLLSLVSLSIPSLTAQELAEWDRVYTFDESIIEMNTSLVTFISKDISRVRFRWTFNQPQLLNNRSESKYQSRLEVTEFNCSLNRYRPYHLTFYDAAGNIVHIQDVPGEWRPVTPGSMMEKLFIPACELVKKKTQPVLVDSNKIEMERVAMYAYLLTQHLERTKDFKPIIDKFFVANYLNRYLQDKETNWFLNLDRNTAAKVSRKELQRFYVALMNAAFLSSVYLISQYPDSADQVPNARLEKLVPTDIWNLIKNHPYTAAYKGKQNNYDFLAEKIDTVKRLNLYTDLLEKIAGLMRQHVTRVSAERSKQYQEILRAPALYKPKQRVCMRNCLGLPDGTKLFEVDLPVFQLQLAEIGGHLKVVSATSSFQ